MRSAPLEGIKIVSLALNLPGPVACVELQRLGATVTKIEPPAGDQLEAIFPKWYRAITHGQTILKMDLTPEKITDADRKQLDSLLSGADLLLTASRPTFLKKIGMNWDVVHAKYSRLCHVAIVGYPPPNDDKPGHDLTYQAEMGLLSPPAIPRILLADFAGAQRAVSEALAVLLGRERSGKSDHAVIALSDALELFRDPLRYGAVTPGAVLGGGHPGYGLYRSQDGWIALAALEEKYWKRLIAELKPMPTDQNGLGRIFLTRASEAWETWAKQKDIPLVSVKEANQKG